MSAVWHAETPQRVGRRPAEGELAAVGVRVTERRGQGPCSSGRHGTSDAGPRNVEKEQATASPIMSSLLLDRLLASGLGDRRKPWNWPCHRKASCPGWGQHHLLPRRR